MFKQIKQKITNPEIQKILSACVFDSSEKGMEKVSEDYQRHSTWQLFGWHENETIIGICGFEVRENYVEILHLAVDEAHQKRGTGSKMINALKQLHPLPIEAETDDDAVDFYRKNGFETTAFQKYNVTRYTCVCK